MKSFHLFRYNKYFLFFPFSNLPCVCSGNRVVSYITYLSLSNARLTLLSLIKRTERERKRGRENKKKGEREKYKNRGNNNKKKKHQFSAERFESRFRLVTFLPSILFLFAFTSPRSTLVRALQASMRPQTGLFHF